MASYSKICRGGRGGGNPLLQGLLMDKKLKVIEFKRFNEIFQLKKRIKIKITIKEMEETLLLRSFLYFSTVYNLILLI